MGKKRKMHSTLFVALLWFITNGLLHASDEFRQLNQNRRSLQRKISEVRLTLLQKDPELRELHERIISLQKSLIKKLDSHPEMQSLQTQIKKIEELLKGTDSRNAR